MDPLPRMDANGTSIPVLRVEGTGDLGRIVTSTCSPPREDEIRVPVRGALPIALVSIPGATGPLLSGPPQVPLAPIPIPD